MRDETSSKPVEAKRANVLINTQAAINQHLDLVRAHNAVHPDRSQCGGVGACLLLSAECDSEREIIDYLGHLAKQPNWFLHLEVQAPNAR